MDLLRFQVHNLREGERHELHESDRELAIVTVTGAGAVRVDGEDVDLERGDVFAETASLLYLPPGTRASLTARADWSVAVGSAPATGRYPIRLITPGDVVVEMRGGGAAVRQVNHLLAHPLPAERLIVYEVFVPAGAWAGWPPHCHDGTHGSPYLEETYYFRFDRPGGFGFHRNYDGNCYDETFTVGDGTCVEVPRGFHVTTAAPGHNMWILNFLAGELQDEKRATPPYVDPAYAAIVDDWDAPRMALPVR